VVCEVSDTAALLDATSALAPDLVIQQLADLPDNVTPIPDYTERNNRIRTEATRKAPQSPTRTSKDASCGICPT